MMNKYFANLHVKIFVGLLMSLTLASFSAIAATPVNTVPANFTISQNKPIIFNESLSVTDVDGGSLTITLTVSDGSLNLGTTTNITGDLDGSDGTLSFVGPIPDLNAALADLRYFTSTTTPCTFTMMSDDGGTSDTDNFTIFKALDNALGFDGIDDVLNVGGGEQYFIDAGGSNVIVTYEAWILIVDDGSAFWSIMEMSNATNNAIFIESDGSVVAHDATGLALTSNANTFPIDGNWHHLAFVDDGSSSEVIYVDGVPVGIETDNFNTFDHSPVGNLTVGDRSINNYEFSGKIDELRIWSTARSQAEIAKGMEYAMVGDDSDLLGYFRMDHDTPNGASNPTSAATNSGSGAGGSASLSNFSNSGTVSNWVYGQNTYPKGATGLPTAIGGTSVTFNGAVSHGGTNSVTERGFVYSVKATNATPIIGGTSVTTIDAGGVTIDSYTFNESGLTTNTEYVYRAYVTNASGTSYGAHQSFTTLNVAPPTLTTNVATALTSNSAQLGGEITSDGGDPSITERGIVFSLTSEDADPVIENTSTTTKVVEGGVTLGTFNQSITGLTPGGSYSYKAYAINGSGTGYGPIETFTLAPTPTINPGEIAFTMMNETGNDFFAFVALKTIPNGTEIHFSDNGYDVESSDFFSPTLEGFVTFTATKDIDLGDQVYITVNGTPSAILKSDGSVAGNIVEKGTFDLNTAGDNILAFQGILNTTTDYVIGGFIAGILADFSSGNMNGTTDWTAVAATDKHSELPVSLTNGVNAVSLFPSSGPSNNYHRYNFDDITLTPPGIPGTAPTSSNDPTVIRNAVNDRTNWDRNRDGSTSGGISDLGVFNINTPPTITLDSGPTSFTENAGIVQVSTGATVADNEENFNTGTLTIQITANANPSDQLLIAEIGNVTLSSTNVQVSGVTKGTASATSVTGNNTLTITFNASATVSDIQEIVRVISFDNTSEDPTALTRTVTFTLTDAGAGSDLDVIDISIIEVNDEPILTATGSDPTFTEGSAAAGLYTSASVSTIEAGQTITGFEITIANVVDGTVAGQDEVLNADGSIITLDDTNSGTSATNTLGYTVSLSGSTATITFSGGSISGTSFEALINDLSYENNSDDPSTTSRIVTITSITDNGGTDDAGDDTNDALSLTSTVSISPINDEPTVTATASNPTFTEGSAAAGLFTSTSASTIEAGQTITDFVITITNVVDGSGFDEVLNADGSAITLDNGNSNSSLSNTLTYSVSLSVSTATITFSGGTLSEADFEALINDLSYENNSDDPSTSNRVVTITSITDDGGTGGANDDTNDALSLTSTVSITTINDEPTLTATGANPTFTEGSTAAVLYTGTSASTIESGQTITGFVVTVTNVVDGAIVGQDEVLNADGSVITLDDTNSGTSGTNTLGFSVSLSGATATVTFSGGSMTELAFETLIDNLSYENYSDDPSTTSRVVTITSISDDGGNSGANDDTNDALSITSTVAIIPTNDAPILSNTASFTSVDEDVTGNTGTLVSSLITSFGANYNEIDSGDPKGFAVVGVVETNGSWEYTVDGSTWLSLTGVSPTNAVLLASDGNNALRFIPNADYNGSTGNTVSLKAWDQTTDSDEDTGVDVSTNGGTTAYSSGTGTASITINPINDEPSFTVVGNPADNTSSEGLVTVASFIATVDLGPADEDIGSGAPTEQAISSYNIATNSNASLFSVAPAISTTGTLTYTLAVNAEGNSTIGFQLQDDGGTANPGDDDLSPEVQFTITSTDDEAPGLNAADPLALGPDTETQIKFFVNLNENATIYYLVREVPLTPSKADILSGTALASDIAGSFSYTNPTNQVEEIISTLTQNTTYYVYWYAVDESAANNETAIQDEGGVTTTEDVIAPQFDGTTGITGITATSLDIDIDLDAAGTAFYVILLDGSTAPSVTQVINGTDSNGDQPVAKGSIVVGDPGSPESETVDFLQSSTTYDIYLVAQDGNGNKSAIRLEADKTTNAAAVQSGGNVTVTRPADLILCLGEDYAALGEIKLQEAASNEGGFPNTSLKTLVLTLPPELEFNTSASISISDDGGNDDFNPEINTTVPVLTKNSISLSYDTDNTNDQDEIKINGLQVKAVEGFAGTKSLLRIASNGGTATIDGIVAGDGTSFANFSVASASAPPVGLTVTYCSGDVVDLADFTTNDADFEWYTDFNLTNSQHSGLITDPELDLGFDVNVAETTTLYVTNTGSGECESQAVQVDIVINPSPVADAGFATQTVCAGEELFVGGFPSLETPTVGGTYIYQWRSEAALRAIDANFDAGISPFTATGATSTGAALAFDKSSDAVRIAAGQNIVSPGFTLFNSKSVLFFYGRAESVGAVGASLKVFGADNPTFTDEMEIGTATTNSTAYKQFAIEIPEDETGTGTFYIRIEYDNTGGEDVAFIIDELILDKGLTDAVEAKRSNPFFFPPSNSAGGGDLVYDVVLTIHDPNYCSSEVNGLPASNLTVHDKIEAAITVRNQDLLEISGSVDVSATELILDISPAALQAPPDPLIEFSGTGIIYDNVDNGGPDNGFGKYEFFPTSAGEGVHNITYIATDADGCEESASTAITVVSSSDFDALEADQCRDVAAYNIYVSDDLIAEIDAQDSPNPTGKEVDYEFDHIEYGDGTVLVAGDDGAKTTDYTYDPAFQYTVGGSSGLLYIYVTRTTYDNTDVYPGTITDVTTGQYKTSPARVYDIPTVQFQNLPALACEQDGTLQLEVTLDNVNFLDLAPANDQGTYEIKEQGASDASYVTIASGDLDFDDPMNTGAGTGPGIYTIRYTSDQDNDPNPNFASGCSVIITQDIEIIAKPAVPFISSQAYSPSVTGLSNLAYDGTSYTFVYCEGESVRSFYMDFTDAVAPFGSQDTQELYFRWYNDDLLTDELNVFAPDNRLVNSTDLFPDDGGVPSAGTYFFYVTQTTKRSPIPSGSTFEGCESEAREIEIIIIAEPETHDLTVGSGYYDDTSRQIREYCEGDVINNISVNTTTPDIDTDLILWLDEFGSPLVAGATVSATDLGFASNTPPVKTELSSTATIKYEIPSNSVPFNVGEFAVFYTLGTLDYTILTPGFIIGEEITSTSGAKGNISIDFGYGFRIENIDNSNGIFKAGDIITGSTSGATAQVTYYSWSDLKGYGIITSNDGSTLEINISNNDFDPSYALLGNGSGAQADPTSITIAEIPVPYTFFYARVDENGLITEDASEGDFPGCSGPVTQVDILIYPKPAAPLSDAIFDDEIYACVGDIVNSTVLKSPIGGNAEKIYYWYETASGGTSFANTYDPASTDINKNADIIYSEIPVIDLNAAGVTTLYLSQADYAGKSGTGESIDPAFVGCESDDRTPVTITLFAKPDAPDVTVTDDGGSPLSIASSALPNSDRTYLVCRNEINDAYNFATSTTYAGAHGVMYNWYTANPTTGALSTFIGSFAPGSNPDPSTDLGLVGATGAKYFGITQTTDIVSGGEFGGCTGDPLIIAINITGISTTPSVANAEFYLCFGDEVQAGDLTATGESGAEFYWYSNVADIGNPLARVATTFDPTGSVLGLSSTTAAGSYTYYVTQATNFDRLATPSFEGCETPSGSHKQVTVHIEAIETGPTLLTSQLDRTICEGETFTAVSVTSGAANSYQWYRDAAGTDPIAAATGSSYLPVVSNFTGEPQVSGGEFVASFSIYVSQFTGVSDCESNLTEVELTVNPTPISPVTTADSNANVYEICQNGTLINPAVNVGALAAGEQYNWYSDAGLNNLVASGITFNISTLNVDPAIAGSTNFWVAKTENVGTPSGFAGCEGPATMITYTVHPLPVLDLTDINSDPLPTKVCVDNSSINLTGNPASASGTFSISTTGGIGLTDNGDGTAVFNPLAAVGVADPQDFLDQSELITITYTYTDGNTCVNSISKNITVTGLPALTVTFGREGQGTGSNEFCIDDTELNLIGNPSNATGIFSNAINNSAIDNTVGNSRAEIDLFDAFETVNPARDLRQVDYVVTFTYTNADGCVNTTDVTIKINNTPEPAFTITRPAEALSSSTVGVDVEVCIDDLSTSSNLTLNERIVLLDNTDVSMGTLTTGVFSGDATGVPLSAAALSRSAEGEYYFYPAQAIQDAVSGNPVSFSNSEFVDFTIDYTFTNDLTCAGKASDVGNKKVIRVYRLPVPVVSVTDNGPNNNKEYCIDHGSLITLSTTITHNPGGTGTYREQNTGITLPVSVLNNAAANGVSTSVDVDRTATFDTEAAYTFAQDNGLLDATTGQAIFNIVYDYTTDVACSNVSSAITLIVNPYPEPSFTYEQGGAEVDNEVCVDEGTLTLRSALGEGRSATFSAVGFASDAITDKVGTATIDIEQLFKEAVAANLGAIDDSQISVDINLNFEDTKFCSADIVQTLIIHNLPVPTYDITQNGVSLVSGNLVEVCIDDMSVSGAADSEKIVLIDVTDQVAQGSRTSASFAGSNYNFSSNQLENVAEGKAYFYPREAVNFAELSNSTLKGATSIDFVFDMSYQNENGCTGKTLSSDASNGVLDFDNRLTIRVYRTPTPVIKVKEGSFDLDENAYCINDDVDADPIRVFVQSIGFDTGVGNGGTFVSDPSLSASALYGASVNGGLDEIFFNPAIAYAEHPMANSDNGDAAVFKITYLYGTSDNGCQAVSNEVTITVNPLPFPTFTVEGVAYNENEFCIDANNAEMTGSGFSDKAQNNAIRNSISSFTNPENNNAGIIPKTPGISDFNFKSAYDAAVSANLADPRTHTITYTYTNNETGCTASVEKDIIVNTKPVVTINSVGGCDRTPVDFEFTTVETAPGDIVQGALWDFDDLQSEKEIPGSNSSSELSPSHLFSEPGEYFVTLTTTSLKGCTSLEVTEQVVVGDIPDVNFSVEGLCSNDDVIFIATPTSVDFGSVASILFEFGDGTSENIDTQGNPDKFTLTHNYAEAGVYDVQLTLTTNNGCEQVHIRRVSILPNITAPYFEDFEGSTIITKDFEEWEQDAETDERRTTGEVEIGVIIESSGWSVDLRPVEDKDDEDWGKLPSDFNSWQFGIPSGVVIADDGVHNNVWTTNLDGNYINGEARSWVYSPCFDFSNLEKPMVSFDQIYHFPDQRDGVVLQYSVDGGEEWVALGDYDVSTGATGTEWFTHENISGKPGQQELQATNEGDIGWAGNKGVNFAQWVSARHKLDAIPMADRSSVIFRFALGTDASAESEGMAFDNFRIRERDKIVLVEQFSSTNVQASATVDAKINAILDDVTINNGDILRVNYHTSFKGELDEYDDSVVPPLLLNPDPISIVNVENPSARAVFYGVSAAPTSILNGAVNGSASARTEVPWTVNNMSRRSLEDVLIGIEISDDFGSDPEVLEVDVTATVLADITNPANPNDVKELSVYIAIVENTVALADAANGQVESRAALRKMLPNGIGKRFKQAYVQGTELNVSEKWDIQKGVDAGDLSIVVFIQDVASKQIYQAQSKSVAGKTSPTITGIDDAFGGKDYSLYPNPANKEVFVVFDRITTEVMNWSVYDQTGKVYRNGKLKPGASGFSLETDVFPSGMYFISINGEHLKLRNKKLMVTH